MNGLTIFYDAGCGVCSRFRDWMTRQPADLALEFLPYDSEEARRRFPELTMLDAGREIVVIGDDGSVWQGPGAWVTCLWALPGQRRWARRLASPALLPLAAKLCHLVSGNRMDISQFLGLKSDRELAGALHGAAVTECEPAGVRRETGNGGAE